MAFAVVERNTFLGLVHIDEIDVADSRIRSMSVPRSWKPRIGHEQKLWSDIESVSTEAPNEGSEPYGSEIASDDSPLSVTAKLAEVQPESKPATRLKLSAQAYRPAEVSELMVVFNWVKLLLGNYLGVEDVVLTENKAASSMEMRIRFCQDVAGEHGAPTYILEAAQDALLSASESSQSVYILGYGSRPFDHSADMGFKASLCIVPQSHADVVCRDTLRYGHCKRGTCCYWDHPADFGVVALTVIFDACSSSAQEADTDTKLMPVFECQC